MPSKPQIPLSALAILVATFVGVVVLSYPLLGLGSKPDLLSLIKSPKAAVQVSSAAASSSVADKRVERGLERMKENGETPDPAKILPPQPLMQPAVNPWSRAGVYLTSARVAGSHLDEIIQELKNSGGNALIFDVKGSRVYFDTTSPIAKELNLVKPVEDLPAIIQKLHDNDIYVMGRFIAIKDDGFTGAHPESSVRHPTTNEVLSATWIDPANEYAQQYNMEVLCDLAKSGMDEVNFDYIRFSTENFIALGVFSAQEKADKVYSFVKKARETIDECGPTTKLGISTYAILGWNYPANLETLGQDFVRFAPLVDVISPMAYPATFSVEGGYYNPAKHKGSRMYHLVYRTMTGYQDLLGEEKKKLRPWIQGYSVNEQNVKDQIQAVFDTGHCGFQFWNAGNNYDTVYAGMSKMTWPEHCVK